MSEKELSTVSGGKKLKIEVRLYKKLEFKYHKNSRQAIIIKIV